MCARNKEQLNAFSTELQGRFPRTTVDCMATDLTKKSEAKAFASWLLLKNINIDVLVNNVGTFIPGNISDEPDGALEEMLSVNLYSAYHLTRALLPKMIENRKGHIFNMSSIAALRAYPNGGAYSISKFALAGFSKNLREELKPHGIKVTTIYSGAVYTDSWKGSGVSEERIMEAADIAKVVYSAAHLTPQATIEEIIIRPQLGDL
jgi:short-subunit dehydrogenase